MKTFSREQITTAFESLPKTIQDVVFTPETERRVQKIGLGANLLIDQIKNLNIVVNYTIMNLIPRATLSSTIEQELMVSPADAQKITKEIEVEFFSSSTTKASEAKVNEKGSGDVVKKEFSSQEEPTAPHPLEKIADVAPDNLPTEETAPSFLPNLAPKTVAQTSTIDDETPLFEQKMKKVFTGTAVTTGDLALEVSTPPTPAPAPQIPVPQRPGSPPPPTPAPTPAPRPTPSADPYREPIE